MEVEIIVYLLFLPFMTQAIRQTEIIVESIPNGGVVLGGNKFPLYRSVLDLTERNHIRVSVKAANDAFLLFSERYANSIVINTDTDLFEVLIGGWSNTKSVIRVGDIATSKTGGVCDTPNILDATDFRYFWIAWNKGLVKVGSGFTIGQNVFMQKSYPATTDVKYLSLWNGWGSDAEWKIYAGILH